MTITAAQIINLARNRHPAFDQRRYPDTLVFGFLSQYILNLWQQVANIDPSSCLSIAETDLTTLTPETFDTFPILPADMTTVLQFISADVTYANAIAGVTRPVECRIVPFMQRWDSGFFPAIMQGPRGLFFKGTAGDWWRFSTLTIYYIQAPVTIQLLSDEVFIPGVAGDLALPVLADYVAAQLALRGVADPSEPAIPIQPLQEMWRDSEQRLLDLYRNRQQAFEPIRTRDVTI